MSYIGNQPTSVAFLTDQFSGTGSQTAFTLSAAPANTASIIVAVSGVLQDPTTYSTSGLTLTFSAAPPSGTGNISVRFLGIPASNIATTAYRTLTEFTATAGQTTFTVPSYTVGYISVYRNGVMLGTADFTATSGTTVVLATGATAGDLITTESFYVSSVLNAIPAVAGAVSNTYLGNDAVTTAKIADANVTTAKIADANVTPAKLSQPLTRGTVVSASGTSIDFTGIPSWVKRITIMFQGVSTNGSSPFVMQLGTSSGVVSTGYLGAGVYVGGAYGSGNRTDSLLLCGNACDANTTLNGQAVLTNITGNSWTQNFVMGQSDGPYAVYGGGSITLAGVLTQVRITTAGGTANYDAGTINILYE